VTPPSAPYARPVDVDRRVRRFYETRVEEDRLWSGSLGALVRLRTWDIFARHLPPAGRVLDVGGGPGIHAAHLAGLGYDVTLVDPVPGHVEQALDRAAVGGASFAAETGDARQLAQDDGAFDAVLVMGPLYHLPDPADRARALREAWRTLRPGGVLVAEVITRHAWILDATTRPGVLDDEHIWDTFATNIATGSSTTPERLADGSFWAYFHTVDEIEAEVAQAGFGPARLLGVEGHAWLLGSLDTHMADPAPLLRVLRLVEHERTMLGVSAHVMALATKPAGADR
jgi:SAM-dependent methyltransferase